MALLPLPLIREIHRAAVKLGLERARLLDGIDASFAASLAEANNPSAQIYGDLHKLNDTERLLDHSVPLAQWLENAIAVAGSVLEVEIFRRALAALPQSSPPPPAPLPLPRPPPPPSPPPATEKVKILFLGANPSDLTVRALGAEVREIGGALQKADMGDRFKVEQEWAVRVSDLQQCLLAHRPHIVHFSGHGTPDGKIIVEDAQGRSFPVSPRGLATLFEILRDNIRCVVLNACSSQPQAEAIAEHIDCVVGMSAALHNAQAISFSTAFYRALGFGRSVREAFMLGCNLATLEGIADADIPVLICRRGVRPEDVRLVQAPP